MIDSCLYPSVTPKSITRWHLRPIIVIRSHRTRRIIPNPSNGRRIVPIAIGLLICISVLLIPPIVIINERAWLYISRSLIITPIAARNEPAWLDPLDSLIIPPIIYVGVPAWLVLCPSLIIPPIIYVRLPNSWNSLGLSHSLIVTCDYRSHRRQCCLQDFVGFLFLERWRWRWRRRRMRASRGRRA